MEKENSKLVNAQALKDKELAFVENAFYTSNEEGMGVSPNAFTQQNKMPTKSSKGHSSRKKKSGT